MGLIEKFSTALNNSRKFADNGYLRLLSDSVKTVEAASQFDKVLDRYIKELEDTISQPAFPLDGQLTNDFAQKFAEAHFYQLCSDKGIKLERLPGRDYKTPDFKFVVDGVEMYFEIKTPSIVGGKEEINEVLYNSLNARIDIEKQLAAKKQVAIATSEMSFYGAKPQKEGLMTSVLNTLIDKGNQNIKKEQFSNANTFLVLNLCLVPPYHSENSSLRPICCDHHELSSGELWMTAFAEPGMLIHGIPEAEGKAAIEGTSTKYGILAEPLHSYICGMLIVVYPLRQPPDIFGLFRSKYFESDTNRAVNEKLLILTGINWNDDRDSNGWQLKGIDDKSGVKE